MSEQASLKQAYRGQTLDHLVIGDGSDEARSTVLIIPTVMGVQPLEIGFGEKLVARGHHVVIADLFGRRFTPEDRDLAFAAMGEVRADRAALQDRLLAVLDIVRALDQVDTDRIAVVGYCFGGQCALDVARSGADVAGVASFHGLFDPPGLHPQPIKAKVLAMHGWDDPMVPPDAVVALAKELTESSADWQIHAYGHTGHGFTNPDAGRMGIAGVAFDEAAARRSWTSLEAFLAELFG